MNQIAHCYKNYANFNGRATRTEFWLFYLFTNVVGGILMVLGLIAAFTLGIASIHTHDVANLLLMLACFAPAILFIIANFIPFYAVGSRRLHDAGFSGWLQLLIAIPLINIALIILWCVESQHAENQYGPDPFNRQPLPKY